MLAPLRDSPWGLKHTDFISRFYIEAKDHGDPALSSQVLVNVVVRDISDNAPVFNKSVYTVSISEDTAITTDIIQVGHRTFSCLLQLNCM